MNIKAALTISRLSSNKISIRVQDRASRAQFLELEIDPADFADAITGLALVDCSGQVRGLEHVGKNYVTETRRAEYTGPTTSNRDEMECWLKQNCQEEGWIIDPYLGS